jgi:hypothetical protein
VSRIPCRMSTSVECSRRSASRNQVPIAVPPSAASGCSACLASSRVRASATASVPPPGYTSVAWCVPPTTAKYAPSRTASIAAAVAALAACILVGG